MLNTAVLDPLSPENPRNHLYDEAIAISQGGKFDNLNKRMRFYQLSQLVLKAIERNPALDLVECGCWYGHSTAMISKIMRNAGCTGKLFVFDSFEGLSPFTADDISEFWTTEGERETIREHFVSSFQHVESVLAPFGTTELRKGWIPEVFATFLPRQLSFVSIDVDLYEPTRDSIKFLYPQLRAGGIMYFDDYGYRDFPGAKKAVDEFLSSQTPGFFFESSVGSAFLIK